MQSVRDYWDLHLEHNPLRVGPKDTDAAAFLAWMIEAAGDIIRELAKRPAADRNYVFEKFRRLKKYLDDRDWYGPISPADWGRLQKTKDYLKDLPTPDKMSEILKRLITAITERDTADVRKILDELEPLLRSDETYH